MTSCRASMPRVDVHLTADDLRNALRTDADRGLRSTPKDIPPKWFYDTAGRSSSTTSPACPSTTPPGASGRSS